MMQDLRRIAIDDDGDCDSSVEHVSNATRGQQRSRSERNEW